MVDPGHKKQKILQTNDKLIPMLVNWVEIYETISNYF